MNPHAIANLLEEITPGSLGVLTENTSYPIAVTTKGGGNNVAKYQERLARTQNMLNTHPNYAQYYLPQIEELKEKIQIAGSRPRPAVTIHCHEIFDAGDYYKLGILPGRSISSAHRSIKNWPRGWAQVDNSQYDNALAQLKQLISGAVKQQAPQAQPELEFAPDMEDGSIPETETWGQEGRGGGGGYERFARKFNITEEQLTAIPGAIELIDAIPQYATYHLKYSKILTVRKENVANIQRA